jgi:hypothetical protein
MTGILKEGRIYKTPICYHCDHKKHPHGKTIINDPLAQRTPDGWICGVCIVERNQRILESMQKRMSWESI